MPWCPECERLRVAEGGEESIVMTDMIRALDEYEIIDWRGELDDVRKA
jgi:hypothetical protein